MICGDMYQCALRKATTEERDWIENNVCQVEDKSKAFLVCNIIFDVFWLLLTVLFYVFGAKDAWSIIALSPLIIGVLFLMFITTGELKDYRQAHHNANKMREGDYEVASGVARYCSPSLIHCSVNGIVGDEKKTVVKFTTDREVAEELHWDKTFLCVFIDKNVYTMMRLPSGKTLIADKVHIYNGACLGV